jgi:hypothetical protein
VASDDLAIYQKLELPSYVLSHSAQSDLAFGNIAVSSAGRASDSRVRKFLVQQSFSNRVPIPPMAGNNFSR